MEKDPRLTTAAQFKTYKTVLFAIAYKMTKSVTDTEDILQDVFISMSRQTLTDIHHPEGYWVKAVMNRCLTFLEKQRQLVYPGVDLPEPLFHEHFRQVAAQDVSYGLVMLLQKLNPVERAVFILRETLDYPYEEIAAILTVTEDTCRQHLHRAKKKILTGKTKQIPSSEESSAFINAFLHTCASGEVQQLICLLREDITIYSDGGGKVSAARHPICGRMDCIRFLIGLSQKADSAHSFHIIPVNGENALLIYDKVANRIDTLILFNMEDNIIAELYFVRNPDKLRYGPLPEA